MKYTHIVASDLDGTLLSGGGTLSPENYAAISEMKKRGICFVPNSGRPIANMPRSVLDHPDIRYYIGADGGIIWDKETDTYTEMGISREEFAPMFELLRSYDSLDVLCTNGDSFTDVNKFSHEAFKRYRVSENYAKFIDYYVHEAENYEEWARSLDSVEMICSFFLSDEDKNECAAKIDALGNFVVSSSEPENIEVFHKKAGKGNTLLRLADMLGVPRENTIAVGDGVNDMDMIEKAGLSLAMSNATEVLKSAADQTICSYQEHSAAYILKHFFGE
jgi:Cof subfamily protein (haloacid dehalogenase superfamily)